MNDSEREHARVVKAAGVVGMATFLSRIFGFLRDMVVAGFFGAGIATDAFFVAFRIPNLLRRLFAEGALTIAFVPVFTECLHKESKRDALDFANTAFTLLSIILAFRSVTGVLLAPFIVMIIAPGFGKSSGAFDLTVFLTRLMFPYIFFISLVALCMGVLNSFRRFAAPALAPVVLNISMIAAALFLRGVFTDQITALAIGVVIGGVLQLAMQFPALLKVGVKIKPDFRFNHPGIKKIGKLMLPAVFGAAVYQINIFIGTLLASFLPTGSVSYLYYADRLVQLPLGVFAIAVGTASLPSFSEQVAAGHYEDLKRTLSFSLRLILFVTIPAMAALIVLRVPIISVLFQRGEFNSQATILTAQALLYYTLGLWAFSVIKVIVSAFYALQDTKTPVTIAVFALFINIFASLLLMFPLKHGGLALATSLASAINVLMLFVILSKRIGRFLEKDFYSSVIKVTISACVMVLSIVAVKNLGHWNIEDTFNERVLILLVSIVAGIVSFAASSIITKSTEMAAIMSMFKKRLGHRK